MNCNTVFALPVLLLLVVPATGKANDVQGAIRIEPSRLRTEVNTAVSEPGIRRSRRATDQELKNLRSFYGSHVRGNRRDAGGSIHLIGFLKTGIGSGECKGIHRFERKGKRIHIVFRRNIHDQGPFPKQTGLYFHVTMPPLPAGNYEVSASMRESWRRGRGWQDSNKVVGTVSSTITVDPKDPVASRLRLMAEDAMIMKPQPSTGAVRPQKTGLDVGRMVALTGPNSGGVRQRRLWALCAAIDSDNLEVRIQAARDLYKLADANAVPVLLAAAKQNSSAIEVSRRARLYSTFRDWLQKALASSTGLNLVEELYDRARFARVDEWLRNVYLPSVKSLEVRISQFRGYLHVGGQSLHRELHVVVRNRSQNDVTIWDQWNGRGYHTVTFEGTGKDGKQFQWKRFGGRDWSRNAPDTVKLSPGESFVFSVRLEPKNGKTHTKSWGPVNIEGGFTPVTLKARFAIKEDEWTRKHKVWAGSVTSPAVKLQLQRRY